MAGQPKTRRLRNALLTRAQRDLDDGKATIWEYGLLWLASGRTIAALAAELAAEIGDDVGRESIRRILIRAGLADLAGDQRAVDEAFIHARSIGASGLAEEAGTILDAAREDRDALTKAKARADYRQ
jgi:hypothetical protein